MIVADRRGRPLRALRVSVTDRCNLRCRYCMPEEDYAWLGSDALLSFEEIARLVDRFVATGVDAVRITGGEPLVRRELPTLIQKLSWLRDLSLTTNGVLLAAQAESLRRAGLHRITVSLDTLSPKRFHALTRRDTHAQVLEGIAAARHAAFPGGLKLDTVLMRGLNDDEIPALLDYAATVGAELRFIEYMDVGGATQWSMAQVVTRRQVLDAVRKAFGSVEPVASTTHAPAERFQLTDGRTFGVISSTTRPFCGTCDRSRLTADGTWFTCLYATAGVDLKALIRSNIPHEAIETLLRSTWERRLDRGAEDRLALHDARGPLFTAAELRDHPHHEMHTRGG
ncbi:MAG: GTP 3',8-cyclase MoaA [Archangium sp.]|nr:GTP 3',8-cyclase MoaA [Archangium sp.]